METSELLKKVRRIEIKTRGLSRNIFAGQYHSAFKGRGMAFSEVREYQYGDDIRDIYLPMGFSNFKIEGRGLGSALILEFLLYYMTRPEYQIHVREKIYLDSMLDLF
jgi:hypothetical protein